MDFKISSSSLRDCVAVIIIKYCNQVGMSKLEKDVVGLKMKLYGLDLNLIEVNLEKAIELKLNGLLQ